MFLCFFGDQPAESERRRVVPTANLCAVLYCTVLYCTVRCFFYCCYCWSCCCCHHLCYAVLLLRTPSRRLVVHCLGHFDEVLLASSLLLSLFFVRFMYTWLSAMLDSQGLCFPRVPRLLGSPRSCEGLRHCRVSATVVIPLTLGRRLPCCKTRATISSDGVLASLQ